MCIRDSTEPGPTGVLRLRRQIAGTSDRRLDRMAKYNQLLRIEEELGDEAIYGYTKIYRK